MQRQDIDYDPQDDAFVWNRPVGPDSPVSGDIITLGRIEFSGDELFLTVNSAQRFGRAREWLEEIPGVTFKGARIRHCDEQEGNLPEDDLTGKAEPIEPTPELTAAMQEKLDQHYVAWVDTPLPVIRSRSSDLICISRALLARTALQNIAASALGRWQA